MVDRILNFDAGISRVIWDSTPHTGALPDRRQLPPSELAATQQLNRLLLADNIDAALARGLRPSVGSTEVLRPDKFEEALQAFDRQLERALPDASPEDRAALEAMGAVLKEHGELRESLNYYRDMLIAG
jgi:hypothetical protein